jgi:hypothetical protein
MCRRNQILGMLLIGLGAGLMIACRVESSFWCTCFGLGGILVGVGMLQKGKA